MGKGATVADWLQLFEAFRTDDPPRHRVWACELAMQFGSLDINRLLEALASDRDGHVRQAAEQAVDTLSRRMRAQAASPDETDR